MSTTGRPLVNVARIATPFQPYGGQPSLIHVRSYYRSRKDDRPEYTKRLEGYINQAPKAISGAQSSNSAPAHSRQRSPSFPETTHERDRELRMRSVDPTSETQRTSLVSIVPEEHKPSLLEELFPEQARPLRQRPESSGNGRDVPILRPPSLDEDADQHDVGWQSATERPAIFNDPAGTSSSTGDRRLTIMLLDNGNPNLSEKDFRTIAPIGWHIGEWRGREDPLLVVPARSEATLAFQNCYFLIFPDRELAQVYKSRAEHLHKLSQVYTPTSLYSALLPSIGTTVDGEDVGTLVREYTLVPPSQPLSLRILEPPYSLLLERVLAARGTVPLVHPVNRAGRSVLLWVDGYQPTTSQVRFAIEKDGQDRGQSWLSTTNGGKIELFDGSTRHGSLEDKPVHGIEIDEEADAEIAAVQYRRWLISFENEAEARRFMRAWHMRSFPLWLSDIKWEDGEPLPLVHTEFMW